MLRTRLFAVCLFAGFVVPPAAAEPPSQQKLSQQKPLPPVESAEASTRARWMMDGAVVDAKSGKPIQKFEVTPGTDSIDPESGKVRVRWRDNLKKQMSGGALRWPRTSGFSVMRFRITAAGYQPLVTQMMRRGGPHIRIRVKLQPEP